MIMNQDFEKIEDLAMCAYCNHGVIPTFDDVGKEIDLVSCEYCGGIGIEIKKSKKLYYLAVPYSNPDKSIILERFHKVNIATGKLLNEGKFVFSPISMSHPVAEDASLPSNWEYWLSYDELLLSRCDELIILMLDGWKESVGVTAEIEIAKRLGKPISYLDKSFVE